jgi:hypothetical protein
MRKVYYMSRANQISRPFGALTISCSWSPECRPSSKARKPSPALSMSVHAGAGAGAQAREAGAARARRQTGRGVTLRHVPNENMTQTLEDSPREGLPPEQEASPTACTYKIARPEQCLLWPTLRTRLGHLTRSEKRQKRTHAVQQMRTVLRSYFWALVSCWRSRAAAP